MVRRILSNSVTVQDIQVRQTFTPPQRGCPGLAGKRAARSGDGDQVEDLEKLLAIPWRLSLDELVDRLRKHSLCPERCERRSNHPHGSILKKDPSRFAQEPNPVIRAHLVLSARSYSSFGSRPAPDLHAW